MEEEESGRGAEEEEEEGEKEEEELGRRESQGEGGVRGGEGSQREG